jgi:ELWxxDGT repeat protein
MLFFVMGTNHGGELWKSDGTGPGTVLVRAFQNISIPRDPVFTSRQNGLLTSVGGTVYFIANDGRTGFSLWKSDGNSTVLVSQVGNFGNGFAQSLTNVAGTLYFTADDTINGRELWKTDGTDAGTILVKDIRHGDGSSNLRYLTNVNGTLFFSANDGINGSELWMSDGTSVGTTLTANIAHGAAGAFPKSMTAVDEKLFFSAVDELHGRELWVADLSSTNDDRNRDGEIGLADLELICAAILDGTASRDEIAGFWNRQNTGPGDANFDHRFDSSDLVQLFQQAKFETKTRAKWREGDWNCDGVFDSGDLVAAFQSAQYESGQIHAVLTLELVDSDGLLEALNFEPRAISAPSRPGSILSEQANAQLTW